MSRVLVIGGHGFYGRYVVTDLLQHTLADIVVAGRQPKGWAHPRVQTAVCDIHDKERLTQLTADCDIVIHCAGPFQMLPLNPILAAIESGCHYIDIAEDRLFQQRMQDLAPRIEAAGVTAISGASVAPGMELLFAYMVSARYDRITSVRTFAAPDTKKHRGKAMFYTMLLGVGRSFWQPYKGVPTRVHGWTEPEWVTFPPPIGRRLTFLVLEMADLDMLPALLGVQTVSFKAGTEFSFLNRLLYMAATIRARTGWPPWERLTPLVRAFSWFVGRWGKDEGAVIFEVTGEQDGGTKKDMICLVAEQDGGLIPSVLASMAAGRLLDGSLSQPGLQPLTDWIPAEALCSGLLARGLKIWWQPAGSNRWQPFSLELLNGN